MLHPNIKEINDLVLKEKKLISTTFLVNKKLKKSLFEKVKFIKFEKKGDL